MNTRRIAAIVAGLVLLAGSGLGLAGCHSSGAASTTQSDAGAKDALVGSLGALATTSYAILLTTPHLTATGSVDPDVGTVSVTTEGTRDGQPVKIEALAIEQDSWAKIDLGPQSEQMGINPAKWLLLDPTKLTANSLPFDQADPSDAFNLNDLLDGVITVRRMNAQHFTGTIDLAGVRGVTMLVPSGDYLGSVAKDVPFAATLDPQGRLTDLKVAGGSGHEYAFDFGISDYSAAAPVDQPNDIDVVTAPQAAYTVLPTDNLTPPTTN